MGVTPLHWNAGVIAELNVRRAVVRAYELDDVGEVVHVDSGLFGVVLEYLVQSHADNMKPVGSCKSKLLQVVVDSFKYISTPLESTALLIFNAFSSTSNASEYLAILL